MLLQLVAVKETDDSHAELFCSTPIHEQAASLPSAEVSIAVALLSCTR